MIAAAAPMPAGPTLLTSEDCRFSSGLARDTLTDQDTGRFS